MIKKAEFIEKLNRIDANSFELELFSKFLNCHAKLNVFSGDSTKDSVVISDYLMSCVEDFINFDNSEIDEIQDQIYKDYKIAIKVTEYGIIPERLYEKNNNVIENVNQEYFDINNKKEAFESLSFTYASVVEYLTKGKIEEGSRYVGFFFERPWDVEHELQIVLENGKFKQIL